MSGSSLDGLDIAYVSFFQESGNWKYKNLISETIDLGEWSKKLVNNGVPTNSREKKLDIAFGIFLGESVVQFIQRKNINEVALIASHGHTLYHYPKEGITCQIGNGQIIADRTGILTINNLRQKDIDAGGSGAPIVPIGDIHLFKEYSLCLNLGGIANITVKLPNKTIAFDICPANQILNYFANKLGKSYDNEGEIASSGHVHPEVLNSVSLLNYFNKEYPKSLDNSYSAEVIKQIEKFGLTHQDALRTYTEFIAMAIGQCLSVIEKREGVTLNQNVIKLLVTGGGAKNNFLISRLQAILRTNITIPEQQLIDYKEAIVMAFIGVLRLNNAVNCLASVTGAKKDTVCGDIYYPNFIQKQK